MENIVHSFCQLVCRPAEGELKKENPRRRLRWRGKNSSVSRYSVRASITTHTTTTTT